MADGFFNLERLGDFLGKLIARGRAGQPKGLPGGAGGLLKIVACGGREIGGGDIDAAARRIVVKEQGIFALVDEQTLAGFDVLDHPQFDARDDERLNEHLVVAVASGRVDEFGDQRREEFFAFGFAESLEARDRADGDRGGVSHGGGVVDDNFATGQGDDGAAGVSHRVHPRDDVGDGGGFDGVCDFEDGADLAAGRVEVDDYGVGALVFGGFDAALDAVRGPAVDWAFDRDDDDVVGLTRGGNRRGGRGGGRLA